MPMASVRPVEVDWLLIGMAKTYDVLVSLPNGSFTIRAEAQDGSGQALGALDTLDVAPRAHAAKPQWGRVARLQRFHRSAADRMTDGRSRAYALDLTGDMAS